jgi:cytoskeletal protein CcmA (bactofilin family)
MFGDKKGQQKSAAQQAPDNGQPATPIPLLTVLGDHARMEGKFEIADSLQVECEVGGELSVGRKLVIGRNGAVSANVRTVDAIIMGHYAGSMVAIGNVEITETGRVSGNIQTDSLVISKGGFFNGNVTKIDGQPSAQPRVYLLEDTRAGQQSAQQ